MKSCLYLWSVTDVTLQGSDRLGRAGIELGRCSVWNDEEAVGIPSKFERSMLGVNFQSRFM